MLLAIIILAIIILGAAVLVAIPTFLVHCILSAGTGQDFIEKGGGWVMFFSAAIFIMCSITLAILCLIDKWR